MSTPREARIGIERVGIGLAGRGTVLTEVVLIGVFALVTLAFTNKGTMSLAVTVCAYVVIANGLGFTFDRTGLLSMAQAGLMGIGAFAAGYAVAEWRFGFLPALGFALLVTTLAGMLVALASLRAGGHYFLVITFIFTLFLSVAERNLEPITGGTLGRVIGAPITLFGWRVGTGAGEFLVFLGLMVVSLLAYHLLVRSNFGQLLLTTRENEQLAVSLGLDTQRLKIAAFAVSGAFAGVGGAMYAFHLRFVESDNFTLDAAITLALIVLLGGARTTTGPLVGALIVVFMPELLHFSPTVSAGVEGALLIAVTLLFPAGIVGTVAALLRRRRDARRPPPAAARADRSEPQIVEPV